MDDDRSFGSSIAKAPSKSSNKQPHRPPTWSTSNPSNRHPQVASASASSSYSSFIKPATPNAFTKSQPNHASNQQYRPHGTHSTQYGSPLQQQHRPHGPQPIPSPFYHKPQPPQGPLRPWPPGASTHNIRVAPPPVPANDEEGEFYDLRTANITAEDMKVYDGDSEKHMRQLLSGAIGEEEGIEAGSDVVEGFKDDIRLMPHQVRGVQWMKKRETGKNTGGILADVSSSRVYAVMW